MWREFALLCVIETHPVQYHAPVYRFLQQRLGIPVTVIYGSDFSIAGYEDAGFKTSFSWDTDLLSGYEAIFLSRAVKGKTGVPAQISAKGVSRALKKIRPRAVLMTGYYPAFHKIALWQAWKLQFPILFRAETTDHAHERGLVLNWSRDHVLRSIYKRCTKLLYIGQRSLRHFQRLGCSEEKLIFSPYCIDLTPFQWDEMARQRLRSQTRTALGIQDEQKVLLFSGKLIRHKAPILFLRALKQMEASLREKVAVIFMGSGDLEEEARNLVQSEPSIQAHFVGFKNQTQMSPYYHAADLLVLPSRHWETWGLVVNEALHHGLPCVVSQSVGSAPDLIERGVTGEIFKTESETDLIRSIEGAIPLIGRPDIREKCRQKVDGYSVEKAAEGIAKAYPAAP